MSIQGQKSYFIRVTDVQLLNTLYSWIESRGMTHQVRTGRDSGYYELHTYSATLWSDLYLYAQYIAQAQGAYIEAGEVEE
jgi:hypothetical protein